MREVAVAMAVAAAAYGMVRALVPWVIRLAPRIGAMDVPQDGRRMHTRPMPRTGGLAIFAAVAVCLGTQHADGTLGLLWGATVIVVLGVVDDIWRLSAHIKLIFQLLAAGVALAGNGAPFKPSPLLLAVGVLWVTLLVNAHNMIDGLDGLAASVSCREGVGLAVLLLLQGNGALAALVLAMVGALLGFLHFNRSPARVFMGDAGSQLIGFWLGVLSLRLDTAAMGALAPLSLALLFALPLSDLGFAVLRRLLRGQSPFAADRGHWHHRLSDSGLSPRGSCLLLGSLSALGAACAVCLGWDELYPFAVYALLLAVGIVLLADFRLHGAKERRR